MHRVPHYLFGHVDIKKDYNVASWCNEAQQIIVKSKAEGKKIIIVGGTGLYTYSLIHGIATIPEIPIFIRKIARAMTNKELHEELALRDPIAYQKLHLNDTQRLSRAYEVVYATGKSIYEFHQTTESPLPKDINHMGYFLNPSREELYYRIDQRFLKMIEHGAIKEVNKVKHYDRNLQGMKAVGVSELLLYLEGNISLEEAISQAQQATRNYAKRQITWFKNRFKDFTILE
jgi:tRNA dimethylallyltransferase